MTDTARWSPFLLLVAIGGGLLVRDEKAADAARVVPVVAALEADARPELLEGRALKTQRFSDRQTEEQAPPPPTPLPPKWCSGRLLDLRRQPLDVTSVKVVPGGGDVRDWQQRVLRGLPDLETTITGNHFRVPVPPDKPFHLALQTRSGHWWLVENVRPGCEKLVIEVPFEAPRPKKPKAKVVATKNGSSQIILSGLQANVSGYSWINVDNAETTRALTLGMRYLTEGQKKGKSKARGATAGLKEAAKAAQLIGTRLPSEQEWIGSPHSPQTQGVVNYDLSFTNGALASIKTDPINVTTAVSSPVYNGVNWSFQAAPNQNGTASFDLAGELKNGDWKLGTTDLVIVSSFIYRNPKVDRFAYFGNDIKTGASHIKAPAPECLRTRAWDEDTGDEFYCWDLAPKR